MLFCSCNDKEHNERKEMKERLSKLEEKLDELEASLRTKQTEVMHLEADKMRLSQEIKSAKYEVDGSDISISEYIYISVVNFIFTKNYIY